MIHSTGRFLAGLFYKSTGWQGQTHPLLQALRLSYSLRSSLYLSRILKACSVRLLSSLFFLHRLYWPTLSYSTPPAVRSSWRGVLMTLPLHGTMLMGCKYLLLVHFVVHHILKAVLAVSSTSPAILYVTLTDRPD
jgi:hypothetical protein